MKAYEKYIKQSDIQAIHEASLKILKEVGLKFEHPEILEVFSKHGAKVEGNIVYLEEQLIMKAIETIPETFNIENSKGNHTLGHGSLKLMPGVGSIYRSVDGHLRKMTNEDTVELFKISDTSDVIDCNYFNIFLDDKELSMDEKVFSPIAMILKYSNKTAFHLQANTFPIKGSIRESFKQGLELIEKFEGRSGVYNNIVHVNSLSPLCFDHDPLEKFLVAAEMNQPVWFSPCAMPVLTGPPSVAGLIAMTNAEVLGAMVLSQLVRPGLPVVYGQTSASTNLRTVQLSIGAPETALISYTTRGLADFYKVPCRTGGGLSDAKDFDIQAGIESDMMIRSTLEAEPDLVLHACGIMGSFNIISFEKFLMDEETYRMNRRLIRGINTDQSYFCHDLIEKIGPRGNFLQGRTPKMFKEEFFIPEYLNKEDPNQWQEAGSVSVYEKMKNEVKKRLDSYQAPEITKEQAKLLDEYIPAAFRQKI
ncbi:trimethylamine methyltransferase family protein [Eubacteriaceae bacterium ES2]|nr:trimethylamine methyltransferase family protein [Eubacteriaceae bacterium ES2]